MHIFEGNWEGNEQVLIQSFPILQQCIKTKIFDTFIGKWKNSRFNFTYGRIISLLKKILYACNNKLTQLTLTITFCSMHNEIVRTCTSPNTIVNWYGAYIKLLIWDIHKWQWRPYSSFFLSIIQFKNMNDIMFGFSDSYHDIKR